jgi:hypothetical protein
MTWTYDSTRIFVTDLRDDKDQIVARLNPLAGGTTLHFFGWEDRVTKITCYVVGLTDKEALEALAESATDYELSTPYGSWGDYYLKHATFQLINTICQTLRPDLDDDSPVFKVDLDLYRDI